MARKSPLDDLRAEVRRLQGAATKKVSYNRRKKGVELGGTEYDPRRNPSTIKQLRRGQLERFKEELTHFMNRSNNFVPDKAGRPIPIQEWRGYKWDEKRVGGLGRRMDQKIQDMNIPNIGMTAKEYAESIKAKRVTAVGDATNRPFPQRNRKSTNIASLDALRKLRQDMQKRQTPEYMKLVIKRNRATAEKMLIVSGGHKLNEKIKALSDEQFVVLWDYWNFAEAIAPKYEEGKKSLIEGDFSDAMVEVGNLIDDAQKITPGPILPKTRTRRK